MGSRRVAVASSLAIPLALAFSLSLLVATCHFFVLLDGAVSLVRLAVSPVVGGGTATSVVRLAVHCLSNGFRSS
jgi:hypothetical protein